MSINFNELKHWRTYSKQELMQMYELDERNIRREIAKYSMAHPVISLSCYKGYMIVGSINELDSKEKEKIKDLIKHQIFENRSRASKILNKNIPLENVLNELC